mmetsp:Transcript_46937/g.106271  ORF Transcript_46937/g.106271 Transcript_46937/m.106271 type:complete len:345 (-) Transcript_46937:1164-2198(-)
MAFLRAAEPSIFFSAGLFSGALPTSADLTPTGFSSGMLSTSASASVAGSPLVLSSGFLASRLASFFAAFFSSFRAAFLSSFALAFFAAALSAFLAMTVWRFSWSSFISCGVSSLSALLGPPAMLSPPVSEASPRFLRRRSGLLARWAFLSPLLGFSRPDALVSSGGGSGCTMRNFTLTDPSSRPSITTCEGSQPSCLARSSMNLRWNSAFFMAALEAKNSSTSTAPLLSVSIASKKAAACCGNNPRTSAPASTSSRLRVPLPSLSMARNLPAISSEFATVSLKLRSSVSSAAASMGLWRCSSSESVDESLKLDTEDTDPIDDTEDTDDTSESSPADSSSFLWWW